MAQIDALFNLMFSEKASDLHLSSGNPPILRINGELTRVDVPPLQDDAAQDHALRNRPGVQDQDLRGNRRR
jgi:twitching motility protein PilT